MELSLFTHTVAVFLRPSTACALRSSCRRAAPVLLLGVAEMLGLAPLDLLPVGLGLREGLRLLLALLLRLKLGVALRLGVAVPAGVVAAAALVLEGVPVEAPLTEGVPVAAPLTDGVPVAAPLMDAVGDDVTGALMDGKPVPLATAVPLLVALGA